MLVPVSCFGSPVGCCSSANTATIICRETEPALTHPHDLSYNGSNPHMEVLRHLRLQVFTVSPTDDLPYTCFETGTGPMQKCTAVISTSPQNSASVELFMGGEAPAQAPFIECPKDAPDSISLTVAVYQNDARIAHAIIPLSEVWEVCIPFLLHQYFVLKLDHLPVSKWRSSGLHTSSCRLQNSCIT